MGYFRFEINIGERPVGKPQFSSEEINQLIHTMQHFVERTAYQRQYPGMLDETVELITVQY